MTTESSNGFRNFFLQGDKREDNQQQKFLFKTFSVKEIDLNGKDRMRNNGFREF